MIYKFRLISPEVDGFYMDVEIDENQSFLDFHNTIQDAAKYDRSQMASFFLSNEKWEKVHEITLLDMTDDDIAKITLMEESIMTDFIVEKRQKLLYVFDFFSERAFFIELLDIVRPNGLINYPVCSTIMGAPPMQIIINDDDLHAYLQRSENEDDFNGDLNYNIDDLDQYPN